MSKFKKRDVLVKMDIEGNSFIVDFGLDGIRGIIADTAEKVSAAESAYEEIEDTRQRIEKITEAQKIIVKGAINELLQDETASEKIFAQDNTEVFISDVYDYIVREYTQAAKAQS